MNRILITGGNGYIAQSLIKALKEKYNITGISRDDFDLTDYDATCKFLEGKYFDVVLHCAIQGGSRLKADSYKDMDANLAMYYNLLQHKSHYKKLIQFGSGAELYNPQSPYGLSKAVIAKSIDEIDNFYNIRIFGVFDHNELDSRFIKANILRYCNESSLVIHKNKYMDFFYMEDLISLVKHYIENDNLPKIIDCTYSDHYSLHHIAEIINKLSKNRMDIITQETGLDQQYTGNFTDLGLKYIGLESGICKTYNRIIYAH